MIKPLRYLLHLFGMRFWRESDARHINCVAKSWHHYFNNPPSSLPIDDMDKECIRLCAALNRLPGLETTESCCGHGKHDFCVWINVTDYTLPGLAILSRALCSRYNDIDRWEVVLVHADVFPYERYWLRGPAGADGDKLAEVIEFWLAPENQTRMPEEMRIK